MKNKSLKDFKELINKKPLHIATVSSDNKPNLSVASDVVVIDDHKLLISANEMVNTQKNIQGNPSVVITSFNKDWEGVRLIGKAEYFTSGEHFDFAKNTFFGNGEVSPFGATEPKGVIIFTVEELQEVK